MNFISTTLKRRDTMEIYNFGMVQSCWASSEQSVICNWPDFITWPTPIGQYCSHLFYLYWRFNDLTYLLDGFTQINRGKLNLLDRHTLPSSNSFVNITTRFSFCSQIIPQKSSIVFCIGAWAAIYSLERRTP